jgi:multidrug efflux system membrane fusion protein
MQRKRFWIWGCLAMALAFGCKHRNSLVETPIAVQVVTLHPEPITTEMRFCATVREFQRIALSFKVPGTILSVQQKAGPDGLAQDIHEGDVVVADAQHPLARLDDSDYKRRVAAAQDKLDAAKAKERSVAATVTAAKATFERIKSLKDRGSVSQQMFDDTQAKHDSAIAELEAVRREVSGANVALQQAEDDLKHCSLVPSIPKAVISRKNIEQGERVPAGQPVMEIMDLSRIRVAFGVPDTRISQFKIGQTVAVTADALPGERFEGKVTKLSPAADLRTRTFEVEVTIDKPRGLKPGMVVTIIIGKREDMVLIPMTAIQRGETPDQFTVFVVVDAKNGLVVQKRSVKLDGVYDNQIRLVECEGSKVKVGDRIVTGGAFRLVEGQSVRILDVPNPLTTLNR